MNPPLFWETNPLPVMAVAIGTLIMITRLPGVIAPEKFRAEVIKFPRSVMWGRVLLAVVAIWAGVVMYGAATDEWAWARPVVLVGVPVAYGLAIRFADQFLALRGAAALMLLVANLMVKAADRNEHPLRLVVTVLAYLWVVAAIWMAGAPHHFRDLIQFFMANERRCRAMCTAGVIVGAALVLLGAFVY